jgi:hypothetical protein
MTTLEQLQAMNREIAARNQAATAPRPCVQVASASALADPGPMPRDGYLDPEGGRYPVMAPSMGRWEYDLSLIDHAEAAASRLGDVLMAAKAGALRTQIVETERFAAEAREQNRMKPAPAALPQAAKSLMSDAVGMVVQSRPAAPVVPQHPMRQVIPRFADGTLDYEAAAGRVYQAFKRVAQGTPLEDPVDAALLSVLYEDEMKIMDPMIAATLIGMTDEEKEWVRRATQAKILEAASFVGGEVHPVRDLPLNWR